MFKDTCLVALKRKERSPRIIDIEIHECLILDFIHIGYGLNSPNAQAHNHTNAIIIRILIALRGMGCDSKNFGTKIT
jgi:hypothetical protein